jgi:hypothetical protein
MASNFPDDMDDLSFYKKAMKIIKPIDAIVGDIFISLLF